MTMSTSAPDWVTGPKIFSLPRLSNTTNYCYLNSVLHLLAQNCHFRHALHAALVASESRQHDSAEPHNAEAATPTKPLLSACPIAVVTKTIHDYFSGASAMATSAPPPSTTGAVTLLDIRRLMGELDATYRVGAMNDAAEALESILSIVDADATSHREHRMRAKRAESCVRAGTEDDLRDLDTPTVLTGTTPVSPSLLGPVLAFARVRTWTCGTTSSCAYASKKGVPVTQRDMYYVRHVNVYSLLYTEQSSGGRVFHTPAPETALSFSEIVAQRQPEEDAVPVCPGCGERTAASVHWSTPSSMAIVQLSWHTVKPSPAERKYFLAHIFGDSARLEDFVTWGSRPADPSATTSDKSMFRLTSMVLLRSEHYVALVLDPESKKWYLGNDSKDPIEAGSTWAEVARFIWRASLIPILLSFSRCEGVLSYEPLVRPTPEFLETPVPKGRAVVDPRQKTLDTWVRPAPTAPPLNPAGRRTTHHSAPPPVSVDVIVDNLDSDFTPASRKRPRDDNVTVLDGGDATCGEGHAVEGDGAAAVERREQPENDTQQEKREDLCAAAKRTDEVVTNLMACYPHEPKSVVVQVLARASGDPQVAAHELNKRVTSGSLFATAVTPPRYDPLGSIRRMGEVVLSTVLGRAREPAVTAAAPAHPTIAQPRVYRPAPKPTQPLQGRTFIILAARPPTVKVLEATIRSLGGVVASRKESRVMESYVLLDTAFMREQSRRGALHTISCIDTKIEEYKTSGMLHVSVLNAVTARLCTFSQLASSSEFRVVYDDVRAMLKDSSERAASSPIASKPRSVALPRRTTTLSHSTSGTIVKEDDAADDVIFHDV